jgi:hypothetical protein
MYLVKTALYGNGGSFTGAGDSSYSELARLKAYGFGGSSYYGGGYGYGYGGGYGYGDDTILTPTHLLTLAALQRRSLCDT